MQCALYVGAGFTGHWTRGAIRMANLILANIVREMTIKAIRNP